MAINETQRNYIEQVRNGMLPVEQVYERLEKAPRIGYRSGSFLESLIALDSTNRLGGEQWYKLFVKGIINYSTLFDDGKIDPEELVHLEKWFDRYGVGEYAVELLVEITHYAETTPPNWDDLVRMTFKELYSGIHRVSEHGLFVLKRWIDLKSKNATINNEEAELLSHINRHSKGMENDQAFGRLYARTVGGYVTRTNDQVGFSSGQLWLAGEFEKCPELGNHEETLLQYLVHHGMKLNENIKAYVGIGEAVASN